MIYPNPSGAPSFDAFGRSAHLSITDTDDLRQALALDEAHWVAVSAPVVTFRADPVLLSHLDTDGDGRIRAEELKRNIAWLLERLNDHSGIDEAASTLRLTALVDDEEGQRLRRSATLVLDRGEVEDGLVSLDIIRKVKQEEESRGLSEAGLVLPSATDDDAIQALLTDTLATVGGSPHPLGDAGVTAEALDAFLDQAQQFLAWRTRGQDPSILVLGADTDSAADAVAEIEDKIDQHFTLVDAVRLNPRIAASVWPTDAELDAIDFANQDAVETLLIEGPLAQPEPEVGTVLDLDGVINPYYTAQLAALRGWLPSLLEEGAASSLDRARWQALKGKLAPYRAWESERPDVKVGDLPEARLREHVEDEDRAAAVRRLLEESHTRAQVTNDVRLLEKLVLLQASMLTLVNSFVSFPDLYNPEARALFEMGTLVMDGRRFSLAVRVIDRTRHARLSDASNMFVLYATISERQGEPLYEVAVPVTSGGRGNLQVGKWGVFQDIDGVEHHAKVVQIVENPISLREALVAPFKRLGRAFTGQIEKISESSEADLQKQSVDIISSKLTAPPVPAVAAPSSSAPPAPTPASPSPAAPPAVGGIMAGGGIALAALGSSVAFVIQTLADVPWTTAVLVLVSAALVVLLPTFLVAWLKLRRRDLSAILEGSGWGINARMRLTRAQARTFTHVPLYPEGSRGLSRSRWWYLPSLMVVLALVAYLVWRYINHS